MSPKIDQGSGGSGSSQDDGSSSSSGRSRVERLRDRLRRRDGGGNGGSNGGGSDGTSSESSSDADSSEPSEPSSEPPSRPDRRGDDRLEAPDGTSPDESESGADDDGSSESPSRPDRRGDDRLEAPDGTSQPDESESGADDDGSSESPSRPDRRGDDRLEAPDGTASGGGTGREQPTEGQASSSSDGAPDVDWGEQPTEIEREDGPNVTIGEAAGPEIGTQQFREGFVEARIERETGRDVTVTEQEDGSFVVEDDSSSRYGGYGVSTGGQLGEELFEDELESEEDISNAEVGRAQDGEFVADVEQETGSRRYGSEQAATGGQLGDDLRREQAINEAEEQVAEQVDEQFDADLDRGEDFTVDVQETGDGVTTEAELTDTGRKEIAKSNAPLSDVPVVGDVTEAGAAVNFEYEEFRRGLHDTYDDTTQPVEDTWNEYTPDTREWWNENTPDIPDVDAPDVAPKELLGASAAAVAAPEPASSVSGTIVGGVTLAGLGVYSLAQNPQETQTTAQSEIDPDDVEQNRPEIPPGDGEWQRSEIDVSERESVRPEELGVPRDAIERGNAEIRGGEYDPESGEIQIPAEAASATAKQKEAEEEEEQEDEEEDEDEEDEEEEVVVEVPEDFIPDEEVTIGGEAGRSQQEQRQQQQQEQTQGQQDEFADPDETANQEEERTPSQGQRQYQRDEFVDPNQPATDGEFEDTIIQGLQAATVTETVPQIGEVFDEVVGGRADVPTTTPATWEDERQDIGNQPVQDRRGSPEPDVVERVDRVVDDILDAGADQGPIPVEDTVPRLDQEFGEAAETQPQVQTVDTYARYTYQQRGSTDDGGRLRTPRQEFDFGSDERTRGGGYDAYGNDWSNPVATAEEALDDTLAGIDSRTSEQTGGQAERVLEETLAEADEAMPDFDHFF